MKSSMNICIKYCGGCNPRYDRKKIIDYLKNDFPSINIILQSDNKTCDFVVVISGCIRSCVQHEHLQGKFGKIIIKDLKDYDILKSRLELIKDKLIWKNSTLD